jgi:hypothetical protein
MSAAVLGRIGQEDRASGVGFQLSADGINLMAGIFVFPPALLAAYRQAIADEGHGTELASVLDSLRRTGDYAIASEHYYITA